jgi:hypothetical protein
MHSSLNLINRFQITWPYSVDAIAR